MEQTNKSQGTLTILPMLGRLEVVGGPAVARVLDSIHGANGIGTGEEEEAKEPTDCKSHQTSGEVIAVQL